MKENRNLIIIFLACFILIIQSSNLVFALSDYDQKTYQVYSKNKQTGEISHFYDNHYNTCNNHYKKYESYNLKSKMTDWDSVRYSSRKFENTKKSILGDYIKEYSVSVTNNGKVGRYFTVIFELKDKNGFEFTQSITQYLRTDESKKFTYKDTQYEKNEILDWNYNIIPQK